MNADAETPFADVHEAIAAILANDKEAQGAAFQLLMRETEQPVSWTYEVWDDLVAALDHNNKRTRAIVGQLLCNLAKSDTEGRLERDFARIYGVSFDEKFVTARHVMLALWKVGIDSATVRSALVQTLAERFKSCAGEKNATLVRYDILCTLRTLYERTDDAAVRSCALGLIPLETDAKYQKKYASAWRGC